MVSCTWYGYVGGRILLCGIRYLVWVCGRACVFGSGMSDAMDSDTCSTEQFV